MHARQLGSKDMERTRANAAADQSRAESDAATIVPASAAGTKNTMPTADTPTEPAPSNEHESAAAEQPADDSNELTLPSLMDIDTHAEDAGEQAEGQVDEQDDHGGLVAESTAEPTQKPAEQPAAERTEQPLADAHTEPEAAARPTTPLATGPTSKGRMALPQAKVNAGIAPARTRLTIAAPGSTRGRGAIKAKYLRQLAPLPAEKSSDAIIPDATQADNRQRSPKSSPPARDQSPTKIRRTRNLSNVKH